MTAVREAKDSDQQPVMRILESSPQAGAWAKSDLSLPARKCFVAERKRRVVGVLLVACPAPEEAEILTLAVEPASRRQGVATALLREFLASQQGRVFLEVRRSNDAAQQLYSRLGFRPTAVRRDYYASPREDAVIMELAYLP